MSKNNCNSSKKETPPSVEEIKQTIRNQCEKLIVSCCEKTKTQYFFQFEKEFTDELCQFVCLFFQLFFVSLEEKFDYSTLLEKGEYRLGSTNVRTLKTMFGKVRYWRTYFTSKKGGGFYPLDIFLGLPCDGFSPRVMNLATKLSTRLSFSSAVIVFRCFCGWSPSTEAIQSLVLGLGKDSMAYMEKVAPPQGDGEVLIIEADGKSTPTATEEELKKRRGKRVKKQSGCTCSRHRGKLRRQDHGKKKRRKKGDKSKNGQSITLIAMYTLKIGTDGKLHGPINKKIWGSYAQRKVMLKWARQQATKRGFPPNTNKRVHIVVDGEKCLHDGLKKLFPEATFALDIRHLEEKIWKVGRHFHKEGSDSLSEWVDEKRELLYTGHSAQLILDLKKIKRSLSARAKRDKTKREKIQNLINYMQSRLHMMKYKTLIEQDLVIASGIIEGAARYVVGERMDCSGMRWIPERAEALLRLRCIEINGDWDQFFEWGYNQWIRRMSQGKKVLIRQEQPDKLPTIESIKSFNDCTIKNEDTQEAA